VQTIIVGTDTSASADLAVVAAADLARVCDASLVVLYVKPPLDPRDLFDPDGRPDPARYLDQIKRRYSDLKVSTRQVHGDPAGAICQVAEDEGADLVVVGNRGMHGLKRWVIGSVPQAVLHKSPSSVLVVDTRSAQ